MLKFRLSFLPEKGIQIVRFSVDHGADGHKFPLYPIEDHVSLADEIAYIRIYLKAGTERRAGLRKLIEVCTLGKDPVRNAFGGFWISAGKM